MYTLFVCVEGGVSLIDEDLRGSEGESSFKEAGASN
jgi:hypothetical protein